MIKDEKTLMGQTLEEMLTELYHWYFQRARAAEKKKDSYMIGKTHGGVEAVESILLQVVGGARVYELWQHEVEIDNLVDGAKAYVEEHYDGEEETVSR